MQIQWQLVVRQGMLCLVTQIILLKGKLIFPFVIRTDITNVIISALNGHADCKKHVDIVTVWTFSETHRFFVSKT